MERYRDCPFDAGSFERLWIIIFQVVEWKREFIDPGLGHGICLHGVHGSGFGTKWIALLSCYLFGMASRDFLLSTLS